MRAAGERADGARLRALIVILWRAGSRIGEALDLAETDLDQSREPSSFERAKLAAAARLWSFQRQLGHYVGDRRSPAPFGLT